MKILLLHSVHFKDNVYIKFYSTFISEFLKEWDVKFTQLNKKEISYEEYVKWIIGLPDRMTEYELNAQSGHPLYKFKFVKWLCRSYDLAYP